jgi:hypothetical protein
MEPGIMDKRRLPAGDGAADFRGRFSLAVFLFRDFFQIRDF